MCKEYKRMVLVFLGTLIIALVYMIYNSYQLLNDPFTSFPWTAACMMSTISFAPIFVVEGIWCYGWIRYRRKLMRYFDSLWGVEVETVYDYGDLEDIRMYWDLKLQFVAENKGIGYIDELTWHDLDMDKVFEKMSHTVSTVGESYLYAQLHTLQFEEAPLLRFEKMVKEMGQNRKQIGRASCRERVYVLV